MDTISLNIYGEEWNIRRLIELVETKGIKGVMILKKNLEHVTIKISYPRYFSDTNVYSITSEEECYEVQEYFIGYLINSGIDISKLRYKICRVDIPFTFIIENNKVFNSYKCVFYYMGMIASRKKYRNVKSISQFLENDIETITFSDHTNRSSAGKKLIIYNQMKRIQDTYPPSYFIKAIKEYPDLPNRIRLEISKRVYKKNLDSLENFMNLNILGENYDDFKKELLSFLDLKVLMEVIFSEACSLETILESRGSDFAWKKFIYQHQNTIYGYNSIKIALTNIGISPKGIEYATTQIRRALKELEQQDKIDRLNVVKLFQNLEKSISKQNIKRLTNSSRLEFR